MNIERNESWTPYNISSNYAIDPLFGAIHLLYIPDEICIYDNENKELIFSNYTGDLPSFDGDDLKIISEKWSYSSPIDFAKNEINNRSVAWRKLNIKKNIPIIVKRCHWKKTVESDEVAIDEAHGFFLVYNNKGHKDNFFYRVSNVNDGSILELEQLDIETGSSSSLIPGEEYLMLSDRNWNTWNYKFKNIFHNLEVIDYESDLNKIFEEEINKDLFIFDDFIFKPIDENTLVVPYGETSTKEEKGTFYHTINFTYSENFPKIIIEDVSPSFENHDLEFKIGEPYFENGIKSIPVTIIFNRDFTSNLIKNEFVSGKDYELFDDTGFIKIKATCIHEYIDEDDIEQSLSQSCFIVLKSSNKVKPDISITLDINTDKIILKKNSGEIIDLYQLDGNNSTIVGYADSSTSNELLYKNNYKVISDTILYGYSWNKIFDSPIEFQKEVQSVSSLPVLLKDKLFYTNNTNTEGFFYKLYGEFTNKFDNVYSKDKFYSTIKIVDNNLLPKHEKLISFGYKDDLSNTIELIDINNSENRSTLTTDSSFRNCFFIPFCDGFVSQYNENIIKIIVYATKSNDFINKDESYYDLRIYEASIGSICSIEINVLTNKYEVKEIIPVEYSKVGDDRRAIVYFPMVLNPEYIRNGEKSYDFNQLSFEFIRKTQLFEFDNRNKVDLWAIPCRKVELIQNDTNRTVSCGNILDCSIFITDKTHTNVEFSSCDFTAIKDLSNNFVWFSECGSSLLRRFDADYLKFTNESKDLEISHLFYFEDEDDDDSSFIGLSKEILIVYKNGLIEKLNNPNSIDNFYSFDSLNIIFNKIFNVHLSGIHKSGITSDKKTDCTLISSSSSDGNMLYKLHSGDFNSLKGLQGEIIDINLINGILFALTKEGTSLSIYNFGLLHPKY